MTSSQRLPRSLLALLPVCLLLAACERPAQPPQATASPQEIFMENCGPCHGPGGRGPALEELQALDSAALRAGMRNHPTAGQIPQRLSADTIDKLITFLDQ